MTLADIQDEWTADSKIDQTNLGLSAGKIPELHAKYLKLLTSYKLQLRKAVSDLIRMRKVKGRYYRGELSKQELDEKGWDQYLHAKPLKSEMDDFIVSDDDIIKLEDKAEYLRTTIIALEQIMKSINSRTWDVKNAIEWAKFTNGGY
jgi:hypothetical protein